MLRTVAIIALIIMLSIPLFAAEVRGTVTGAAQNPLEGAVVLHRPSGAKAVTDARGEFVLAVPEGETIRLEIIHPDHYEREFLVPRKSLNQKLVFTLVPLIRQNEEVVVTAFRYPEPSARAPAAATVITAEALSEKLAPNIMEALQDVPGVGALGSAGFSLVPSVRGLARRRVLYLIDGARLESDRRTGPNASFVSPEDIDRIEVLRSPSSVFYGSDAIGGVIQVMTKAPSFEPGVHGRLSTVYGTVNGEKGAGLSLESALNSWAFYFSLQYVDAGEYRIPGGARVLQSQYSQGSVLAKISHRTARRDIDIGYLGARGTDIGKPSTAATTKPTWYPRENQNLFQIHWKEKNVGANGEIVFHAFANPNFLETQTDTYAGFLTLRSQARTASTEFGAQLAYAQTFSSSFRLEGGIDYFGRGGAVANNVYISFDAAGAVTGVVEEIPYTGGSRNDLGFFLSADFTGVKNMDLLAGLRYDILQMKATPSGTGGAVLTKDGQGTGFLAISYKLSGHVTAFVNVSRAYRLASINERFYTGISGRGFIVGQPNLRPESGFNLDGGLKFPGRRFFAGVYVFRYQIDDMIERFRLDPLTYTYGNIERGRLQGVEFEAEAFPLPGWKVFGNVYSIRGRSLATGDPLNDIPPFHIYAGTRVWSGRFSAGLTAAFQLAKKNPGPAEIAVAPSELFNLEATYVWQGLSFYAVLGNLFNATYIARPDAEAMTEPGRNLKIGLAYSF